MSDQKLRDLERRWKETGSPDDEAAYLSSLATFDHMSPGDYLRLSDLDPDRACRFLLGRLEAGLIERSQIGLGVQFGHEPSFMALRGPGGSDANLLAKVRGASWRPARVREGQITAWAETLEPAGRGVCCRVALSAAELAVPVVQELIAEHMGLVTRQLDVVRAWLESGDDRDFGEAARLIHGSVAAETSWRRPERSAAMDASAAVAFATNTLTCDEPWRSALGAVLSAAEAMTRERVTSTLTHQRAATESESFTLAAASVMSHLSASLMRWLAGLFVAQSR